MVRLLRGRLDIRGGKAVFVQNEGRGNGSVLSMEKCDLLGIVPPMTPTLPAGTVIDAIRL